MKRRGIGNVIAAAVMVFLIVFTMSQLYVYNIDQLDNYNQVAQSVFNTNAQKQSERLTIINAVEDVTCCTTIKVTLTISNTGGTTSNIVAVWVDNIDVSTSPHLRVPENVFVGQGLTATLPTIDTKIPTSPPSSQPKITVKVVTSLGNSVSVELLPPNQAGTTSQTLATTQLSIVPPNPITGNNIIAILSVTNTNSLGVAFTNLSPDLCLVQGGFPPPGSAASSGTVSSATSNTLSDTSASWSANQWTYYIVRITSGTGAGQSRTVNTNTANQLTTNSPWTTTPTLGASYSIYPVNINCHSNSLITGTASSATSNTLTVQGTPNWATDQWVNYILAITSGTGSGQTALITANNANTLTISASWSPQPTPGSGYAIRNNLCNANSGTASISPVTCSKVQGPTPSGLTFLPAGGSITFQWTYLVSSIIPDSLITFAVSFVNVTTTTGLIVSQIPSQTATVRQVGGTSLQSGQGISNVLGSLTIDLTSFQYAKVSAGSVCWKTGFLPKGSDTTVFRVHVTNIGSTTVTLTQASEFVDLQAASGGGGQLQPTEWFIATNAQVSAGIIAPTPLTPGGGVTIAPGQTVAVYFGSSTQNGAAAPTLPTSGNRLFTFMILLGTQTGSVPSFGESIPFVGLTTASSDPAGCFSGSY